MIDHLPFWDDGLARESAMSGYDEGNVYWSEQGLAENQGTAAQMAEKKFREFIRNFQVGEEFPYRDQLRKNTNKGDYKLEVLLEDVMKYDSKLHDEIKDRPSDLMPAFEKAAKDVHAAMLVGRREEGEIVPDVQVIVTSSVIPKGMRDLNALDYSTLVHVQGIVIAAQKPRVKATTIAIQCKTCKTIRRLNVRPGFGSCTIPRICEGAVADEGGDMNKKCGVDPFVVLPDKSNYVDQQVLKVQELPEHVPTGEMPRNIILSLDRHLVGRIAPGAIICAHGIFQISPSKAKSQGAMSVAVKSPYLRCVGVTEVTGVGGRMTDADFTPEEETRFRSMVSQAGFVDRLYKSVAPAIFGHDNIKKALACQLMGGARKRLPDGARLRGDINILMLGDPSTAKSQLLKFIEKAAPISVYTSGKGSSAAGLTASVIKEPGTGEFFLEGGAMVLADGGVVCIDEFDKMRQEDRVAIHEAMEQQTISIAKAGITTVLNTRTSVLAAANPTFGRYDDMKNAVENIDFQSTILSRFDLIFIIRDERNEAKDQRIARHIMDLHSGNATNDVEGEIDIETLKRFVCFARHKCSPRLSEGGAKRLQDEYIAIRQRYAGAGEDGQKAIPITVRQLEAIIRISESLARTTLSPVATERHVEQAVQLFKESTEDAASRGVQGEGMGSPEAFAELNKAEKCIRERVGVGMSVPEQALCQDLSSRNGVSEASVRKALAVMIQRGEMELRSQGRYVCRKR